LFGQVSDLFFHQLSNLWNQTVNKYGNYDVFTFSAEAVCKNKTTAWTNNPNSYHRELTIAYPFAGIRFLGLSFASNEDTDVKFVPHFEFSNIILSSGFKEPAFWNIEHTAQIDGMMAALGDIIWKRNGMNVDQFYEMFRPENYQSVTAPGITRFVDYEGFIFCVQIGESDSVPEYECDKIKTPEYYKGHKMKEENVAYLLKLAEVAGDVFPIARTVSMFYNNSQSILEQLCESVLVEIGKPVDENSLYSGLNEKAKGSFEKQKIDVQSKMLIAASSTSGEIIYNVFEKSFPEISSSSYKHEEIVAFLRGIVMDISPWKGSYSGIIENMRNTKDRRIGQLFDIMNSAAFM
jgi:hypothetical protein